MVRKLMYVMGKVLLGVVVTLKVHESMEVGRFGQPFDRW